MYGVSLCKATNVTFFGMACTAGIDYQALDKMIRNTIMDLADFDGKISVS